mgnify:CR=1 FL=1
MLSCIESGLESNGEEMDAWEVIDAGDLGYWRSVLIFKCASKRTCEAWISGGPITEEENGNDKSASNGNDAETDAEED